ASRTEVEEVVPLSWALTRHSRLLTRQGAQSSRQAAALAAELSKHWQQQHAACWNLPAHASERRPMAEEGLPCPSRIRSPRQSPLGWPPPAGSSDRKYERARRAP